MLPGQAACKCPASRLGRAVLEAKPSQQSQVLSVSTVALASLLLAITALAGCTQKNAWLAQGGQAFRPASIAEGKPSTESAGGAADEAEGPLALARLSERRGQTKQAEELYQKMIERFPGHPLPHHRLGVMRCKSGAWEDARRHFQRAMELNPDNPELLADVGYFYYLQSMPEEAEKHLRRALEIAPNHAKSCNNLAILLGEQRRDQECLALFRRIGTDAEVCCNMGFVYAQRGDFSQAIQAYSRALTYDQSLRPAAEALAQLAKYGPPASRADGSTADAAAGEPEGSRLVYMMERKADSQIRKDAHVRPASAEMVINSLTDEATASDILPPGRGESSVRYQGRREPLQLVPEPSVPGNFPTAWQPPLPTTPSVHAFSDSPPAPTQPPSGPTQASMPRPLSFSGLPAGPIVGNQRP